MFRVPFLLLFPMLFSIVQDEKKGDEWVWSPEQASIIYYLANKPKGFEVQLVSLSEWGPGGNNIQVRIIEGENTIHKWDTHDKEAFVFSGSTLVYSSHRPYWPGCKLVAWDLKNAKQLWATHLKAIKVPNGSQYSNQINLKIQDGEVTVYGNESRGQYIEKIDLESGKTTSHVLGSDENQRFGE